MEVAFERLADLLGNAETIKDKQLRVVSAPENSGSITITSDVVLNFDPDVEFSCKSIIIKNCNVEISGLTMSGSIQMAYAKLKMTNCRIHKPRKDTDYLVDVSSQSRAEIHNSVLENTERFGICVDHRSTLSMTNVILSKIGMFSLIVTGFSVCDCTDCKVIDTRNNAITIESGSIASLTRCVVTQCDRLGLCVGTECSAKLDGCVLSDCNYGCISANHATRVCIESSKFADTPHSSILLTHSNAMMKDTVITNTGGNAINAGLGSRLVLADCILKDTKYPPLALCDGSIGYIRNCSIANSEMCGVIIRSRSRAVLEKCRIENIKESGIAVSNSQKVSVTGTFVVNCGKHAITVYDHGEMYIRSSFLVGPGNFGVNVFTGGYVHATETTIAGMKESCIWMHHGGSAEFISTLMYTDCYETGDEVIEKMKRISLTDTSKKDIPNEKLFRIETKRPFSLVSSHVIGRGHVTYKCNESATAVARDAAPTTPSMCKVCEKNAAKVFFVFCGHTLYCNECWDELPEKPTTCELCDMPIEGSISPISCSHDSDDTCGICLTNRNNAIILPCGHTICSECSESWFVDHEECPYCRKEHCRERKYVAYV